MSTLNQLGFSKNLMCSCHLFSSVQYFDCHVVFMGGGEGVERENFLSYPSPSSFLPDENKMGLTGGGGVCILKYVFTVYLSVIRRFSKA